MEFSREKMKQIRNLMVTAACLILAVIYIEEIFSGAVFLAGIMKPFFYGGAVAFVLNIPMKLVEEKLLAQWNGKTAQKLKRPLGILFSVGIVGAVLTVVAGMAVPQMGAAVSEIGKKIPVFMERMALELGQMAENEPGLADWADRLEFIEVRWDEITDHVIRFLKNGAGNMLNSTFNMAGSILSGVVNMAVAFVFALYILSQKERLSDQGRRILSAYLPERARDRILEVCSLLHKSFSNFISGQCLEAVILGSMFAAAMSILRMPYALVVGAVIALTALVPIVGAFMGCAVGVFLILMNDPLQALLFVVLFLVLQQIEGNLIYPRVVGKSVGLPSMWVLAAVSIGSSLAGIIGILVFIPLTSACYTLLRESVNKRNAQKSAQKAENDAPKAEQ